MGVCLHVCLSTICLSDAHGGKEKKKWIGYPETGVIDSCKLQCGCCEWNLSPLQKQLVLKTAEPSLQP